MHICFSIWVSGKNSGKNESYCNARQMEEEALKLKQMQSEVDSSFTSPGAGLNTSRDDHPKIELFEGKERKSTNDNSYLHLPNNLVDAFGSHTHVNSVTLGR